MSTTTTGKPPVTQQEDWPTLLRPWVERMVRELDLGERSGVDVDRVHETTGVVAHDVQRSMAPIASYLVGVAVGRGMDLEEACRVVERATEDMAAGVADATSVG